MARLWDEGCTLDVKKEDVYMAWTSQAEKTNLREVGYLYLGDTSFPVFSLENIYSSVRGLTLSLLPGFRIIRLWTRHAETFSACCCRYSVCHGTGEWPFVLGSRRGAHKESQGWRGREAGMEATRAMVLRIRKFKERQERSSDGWRR